jgi:hypothetical protein
MFIEKSGMPDQKKRLLEIYASLNEELRSSLLDYAEFLVARHQPDEPLDIEPRHIPRPEEESVIAAIKRLSDVYPMLDRSKMLHETSGLMSQHLLQGREAAEVIDELEILFRKHYEKQFG